MPRPGPEPSPPAGVSPGGEIRVGTSGWRYPSWRSDFYPVGLRQRDELTFLSSRLNAAELNGSFYSLQRPTSYASWAAQVPDDFCFAVKGGRFITHMRRLAGVQVALANFFASGVLALGAKLGPVLWQLPPNLAFDEELLQGFFALLPRTTEAAAEVASRHDEKVPDARALTTPVLSAPIRHVLEPRHESFHTATARSLLERSGIGTVLSDSGGTWPTFEAITSDLVYARLHGDAELYRSGYSATALDEWAERVRAWAAHGLDVHVYFDNDARGHAPHDAVGLLGRLGGRERESEQPDPTQGFSTS